MNFVSEKVKKVNKKCNYMGITCSICDFTGAFALMFFPEKLRKKYIYYIFGNEKNKIPTISREDRARGALNLIKYYLSIILKKALFNKKYENYNQICTDFRKIYWDYVLELAKKEDPTKFSSILYAIEWTKLDYQLGYPNQLNRLLLLLLHDIFNIPKILLRNNTLCNMIYISRYFIPDELLFNVKNIAELPFIYIAIEDYDKTRGFFESFNLYDYYFELQGISLFQSEHTISLIECDKHWYIVDSIRAQGDRLPILPINNKKISEWKGYKSTDRHTFTLNNVEFIIFCYVITKKVS